MSEGVVPMSDGETVNLACFEIKGEAYAIKVEFVREIVRIMQITPLPNSPSLIEGVIDLRGSVIPVMDLSRALNLGVGATDSAARIVVLEVDGLVLGVWVDAATDVLTLGADQIEDVPDLAVQGGYDVVCDVVRRRGEAPIMVLAVDRIVAEIDRSYRSSRVDSGMELGGAR